MRVAVADPPYPNKSHLYRSHPDYAGEVDLELLVRQLVGGYDGWALATDDGGLLLVLRLLDELCVSSVVGVWVKGARPQRRARVLADHEYVICVPARSLISTTPPHTALVYTPRPRHGDPRYVIGAKPGPWWAWVFELLGARAGDHFTDLFPGSQAGALAWQVYQGMTRAPSTS